MNTGNPDNQSIKIGDIEFKYLFTESKHHILLLKDLVASILGMTKEDISQLTIINNDLAPNFSNGKLCRLDLQLDVDGRLVNIELQLGHAEEYLERSLYYLCRIASSSGKQGKGYGETPPVIGINIVDVILFPQVVDYHTTFHLREDHYHFTHSKNLRLDYLELKKVQALPSGRETQDRKLLWMSFFKMRTKEDVDMMYQIEDPVLRKAVEELKKTTTEQRYQATVLTIEKFERDQEIAMNRALSRARAEAKAEGEAKGRAEGEAKGRAEGEAKGEAKGRAEGLAEGRAEGQALATVTMVGMRYEDCPPSVLEKISQCTDCDRLAQIGRALFTTSTLDEFLTVYRKI